MVATGSLLVSLFCGLHDGLGVGCDGSVNVKGFFRFYVHYDGTLLFGGE